MKKTLNRLLAGIAFAWIFLTPAYAQDVTRPSNMPTGGFITGGASSVTRHATPPEINSGMSTVSFQPGARTIWHAHAGGQIIVVTQGTAWYQEKGKPKQIIKQGEAVMCPPNTLHWHGATPTLAMTHVVATPNLDKGGVTAGAQVSDEEYNK